MSIKETCIKLAIFFCLLLQQDHYNELHICVFETERVMLNSQFNIPNADYKYEI